VATGEDESSGGVSFCSLRRREVEQRFRSPDIIAKDAVSLLTLIFQREYRAPVFSLFLLTQLFSGLTLVFNEPEREDKHRGRRITEENRKASAYYAP
jgi:hypothetical protein